MFANNLSAFTTTVTTPTCLICLKKCPSMDEWLLCLILLVFLRVSPTYLHVVKETQRAVVLVLSNGGGFCSLIRERDYQEIGIELIKLPQEKIHHHFYLLTRQLACFVCLTLWWESALQTRKQMKACCHQHQVGLAITDHDSWETMLCYRYQSAGRQNSNILSCSPAAASKCVRNYC